MKLSKRLLSFCLSVVMLLSVGVCCIVPVSAESTTATSTTTKDTTWFTDPATVVDGNYVISTAEDLLAFQALTGADTDGKTFVLANDIDVSAVNWTGVPKFAGNFDGRGHTITFSCNIEGDTATNYTKNTAFFKNVIHVTDDKLEIKDLILNGTVTYKRAATTQVAVAGLIGNYSNDTSSAASLDIKNVYVDVDVTYDNTNTTFNSRQRVGGIVGYHSKANNTLKFENVCYEGNVIGKTRVEKFYAASFVAEVVSGATLIYKNCLNLGTVTSAKGDGTVWEDVNGSFARTNCIDGKAAGITLDESYLIENPSYLDSWTTCRLNEESEEHTLLPVGIAQMMGYAHSRAWIQKSTEKADNGWKLRILNTVETIDWESLSFEVTIKVGNGDPQAVTGIVAQTTVYNSIEAASDTVTAKEMGGKFIYAIVLDGIPSNTEFTVNVTPIRTIGGVDYRCATQSLTLSFTE